jgi:ERCC4-type nuclease
VSAGVQERRYLVSKRNRADFTIVIDSREQRGYQYEGAVTKALRSGDYSIIGLEDKIAIERKSKQDAFSSLGAGRKRFENEVKRLSEYDYSAIVIESSLTDFLQPPPFTRMSPKAALNSLVSWSVKYKVFIFFASDRRLARALVYRILEKYYKYRSDNDNK